MESLGYKLIVIFLILIILGGLGYVAYESFEKNNYSKTVGYISLGAIGFFVIFGIIVLALSGSSKPKVVESLDSDNNKVNVGEISQKSSKRLIASTGEQESSALGLTTDGEGNFVFPEEQNKIYEAGVDEKLQKDKIVVDAVMPRKTFHNRLRV